MYIYLKMVKKWGGFKVGDIVRFGRSKGEARIAAGDGELVKRQRAVNEPVVETAVAVPKAERAVVDRKATDNAKDEAKARADAKAEAEKKAKAEAEKKAQDDKKGKKDDRRK
jgi:colicin import membrane protein